MSQAKFDPEIVLLEPDGDDGVSYTLQPAEENKITVALKIDTVRLGQFLIPLTAKHFHLLVAVGNELLALPEDKVQRLRRELEERRKERDNDQ
jgi:hypothetical protein